jgi:hypothetical protein
MVLRDKILGCCVVGEASAQRWIGCLRAYERDAAKC